MGNHHVGSNPTAGIQLATISLHRPTPVFCNSSARTSVALGWPWGIAMASIQQKGNGWYCQFVYRGKRRTFAVGRVTKAKTLVAIIPGTRLRRSDAHRPQAD